MMNFRQVICTKRLSVKEGLDVPILDRPACHIIRLLFGFVSDSDLSNSIKRNTETAMLSIQSQLFTFPSPALNLNIHFQEEYGLLLPGRPVAGVAHRVSGAAVQGPLLSPCNEVWLRGYVKLKATETMRCLFRSKYLRKVLRTSVGNQTRVIEVFGCLPQVLVPTIDFMYGISIPEDFSS